MGQIVHCQFLKGEDCRTAYLSEMEFTEMAHVLKMVAEELEQSSEAVIDEFVRGGLDAALATLNGKSSSSVSEAYYRRREQWRISLLH